jgi:hypothetical protein
MNAQQNVDEKNPGIFQSEMALWVGIFTALVLFAVGKNWLMDLSNPLKYGFFFIWLFVVMLWLSFGGCDTLIAWQLFLVNLMVRLF